MSDPFVGEIKIFAGTYAPNGWFLCQGQPLPIAEYDVLYTLLGTTYGGDGVNTFNLPDLRGRMPVHQGTNQFGTYVLGQISGLETVTLLASQVAAHNHLLSCTSVKGTAGSPGGNVPAASDAALFTAPAGINSVMNPQVVGAAGTGLPHDNMSPYLAVNFIIAWQGIFPSQN